jgi:hypothetical protein
MRLLSRDRDVYLDLAGGNRIPKISERKARSVAELRAAGVGVDRVLLLHSGSPACGDLFQGILTMLDPNVDLLLVSLVVPGREPFNGQAVILADQEHAGRLGRKLAVHTLDPQAPPGPELVRLAREWQCDLIFLSPPPEELPEAAHLWEEMTEHVAAHAHCPVASVVMPVIPAEVVDRRESEPG